MLGNKSLLEKRVNIRAADYRFTDKVKYYQGFTTANGQQKIGTQAIELLDISNLCNDFVEANILEQNSKIIDSFVGFLRENNLLLDE